MRIEKYKHACFTAEIDGDVLVVDPGNFSDDFLAPSNVVGIVITHEHADHFDHEQLASIIDKNPEARIIAPRSVTDKIEVFLTETVRPGDMMSIGPFELRFYGGNHAVIHESLPVVENVGIMINELVYYPGDSLYAPTESVDTLALPAAAPWVKIGEVIDYLANVRPRFAFPTHDAILSEVGKSMTDSMLASASQRQNTEYRRIDDAPITI